MCRTGGRRCPCSRGQLDRHNERRRRNRQIKKEVLDHLRALPPGEHDQQLIDRLEAAPPIEAKRWAIANGLAIPGPANPAHVSPPAAVPAPARAVPAGRPVVRPAAVPAGAAAGGPVPVPPGGIDRVKLGELIGLLRQIGIPVASPATPTPAISSRHAVAVQPYVDGVLAGQGQIAIERLLLDSQPLASRRVGRGINDAKRVDLGNGVYAYHKTFGSTTGAARSFGQEHDMQPLFEVSAWRLAERLGPPWSQLVAPCVLREVDGQLGSLSLERPGSVGRDASQHGDAAAAAGFFDRLIGQQDRHAGNYLVDDVRGITLIDHGFSFSKPGDSINARNLQATRVQREPQLRANERDALTRLVSSPDSLGMRGLLPADRLEAMLQRARDMLSKDRLD